MMERLWRESQKGLSLIELMIAILLGILIVSAALTVYVNTVVSSSKTMKMSMLNQELGTLMNVMVSEIRRAGFNQDVVTDPTGGIDNEFQRDDTPEPDTHMITRVIAQGSPDVLLSPGPASSGAVGDCILFAYDADEDGTADDTEFRGFKLENGGVKMRTTVNTVSGAKATDIVAYNGSNYPDSCDNGDWETVTDTELIDITNLEFGIAGSQCFNSSVSTAASNCYTPGPAASAGHITVEAYLVSILLQGELKNDPLVKLKLEQNVRIRNEIVRERQ